MSEQVRVPKKTIRRSAGTTGHWVLRDRRNGRLIERGHQPTSSAKPEDFEPPKGGSSVKPKK